MVGKKIGKNEAMRRLDVQQRKVFRSWLEKNGGRKQHVDYLDGYGGLKARIKVGYHQYAAFDLKRSIEEERN